MSPPASARKPRKRKPTGRVSPAPRRPLAFDPTIALGRLGTGKRIALGVMGLAGATALGLVLRMLGFEELTVVAVLAVTGIALAALSFFAFVESMWLAIAAMLVLSVTPIGTAVLVEVPLLGPVVEAPVAAAPQSPWAAGYRLPDATVRSDLAATFTTVRRGRRGARLYDTFTVAPVVGPGWRPGDAVVAWALADGGEPPAEWSQPACCLARLLANEKHDEVVERASVHLGVATPPERVVGRWVSDAAEARDAGWGVVAMFLGGASASWLVLCLLAGRRTATVG